MVPAGLPEASGQTADDRKRGRMCSRRARNRACGFCDQAFCATKAREGRGSASQTAHSTVFSVIFDFGRSRPVFGRIVLFMQRPPMQLHGKRVGSSWTTIKRASPKRCRVGGRDSFADSMGDVRCALRPYEASLQMDAHVSSAPLRPPSSTYFSAAGTRLTFGQGFLLRMMQRRSSATLSGAKENNIPGAALQQFAFFQNP